MLTYVPAAGSDHATYSRLLSCVSLHDMQEWGDLHTEGPGSTGKKRPESFISSFKLIQETEGCTTTSILVAPDQYSYLACHSVFLLTRLHVKTQSCPCVKSLCSCPRTAQKSWPPGLNRQSMELLKVSNLAAEVDERHTHRYLVFETSFGNLRDLFCRLGICDGYRELVDIDGRPFRVAMSEKIFIVCTNGIFAEYRP